MANGIRIEGAAEADFGRVHDWLSRHRGQTLELDQTRRLELGVPINGAGAVLIAVTLQEGESAVPPIGGVVRAIANRQEGNPVRLVFEGRSPAQLPDEDAESAAARVLVLISNLVTEEDRVAEVA